MIYYTDAKDVRQRWKVRYLDLSKTVGVQDFTGHFDDPGEACEEFKAKYPDAEYLDSPHFKGKATTFNKERRALSQWNAMSQGA